MRHATLRRFLAKQYPESVPVPAQSAQRNGPSAGDTEAVLGDVSESGSRHDKLIVQRETRSIKANLPGGFFFAHRLPKGRLPGVIGLAAFAVGHV
jgi:hypothetical protein